MSFSVFGSYIRGKEKPSSDIDARILYEGKDYGKTCERDFIKLLKRKISLFDKQTKDIKFIAINNKIIDSDLERLKVNIKTRGISIMAEGKVSIKIAEGFKMVLVDSMISSLFLYSLGGDERLENYRKYLLEKLSKMGGDGEKIWLEIIKKISELESREDPKKHLDNIKKYPQTIKEAMKYKWEG